jgi:hypothetical protein
MISKFLILPFLFSFAANLDAINIEKLTLKAASIKNTTDKAISVNVTFQKKCPGCPRLREKYDKSFSVAPQKDLTVKDEPNIIFDMKLDDSTRHLILDARERGKLAVFSVKPQPERTFPRHVDFDEVYKGNDDFDMFRDGHMDYKNSLPENVTFTQFMDKIKSAYNKNNLSKRLDAAEKQAKPRIPKIVHQFWFGKIGMPDLFKQWQREFQEKHPGWLFINWNEDRVKEKFPSGLVNEKIYDEARMMYDYATMSKVLRYEVLNKYGGLYMDPDIRCFEDFLPLHNAYDFYCGFGHFDTYGAINNGIFASVKGHPILKACIDHIKSCETPPDGDGFFDWTAKNLGHQTFTKCVYENLDKGSNVDIVFPSSFFDGNDVEMEFNHVDPPHQAAYEHIPHDAEAFCGRGVYSYVK